MRVSIVSLYRNPRCQRCYCERFRVAWRGLDDDGDTDLPGLFRHTREQFVYTCVGIFIGCGWGGHSGFKPRPGWRNDPGLYRLCTLLEQSRRAVKADLSRRVHTPDDVDRLLGFDLIFNEHALAVEQRHTAPDALRHRIRGSQIGNCE